MVPTINQVFKLLARLRKVFASSLLKHRRWIIAQSRLNYFRSETKAIPFCGVLRENLKGNQTRGQNRVSLF